jgi:hypothetical protein
VAVVVVVVVVVMVVKNAVMMMMMHGLGRRGGISGQSGEADDQGRGGEQFLKT